MNHRGACRGAAVGQSRRSVLQLAAAWLALPAGDPARASTPRPDGVASFDTPLPPTLFRDLALPDLSGQAMPLAAVAAHWTLLHVFATSCEPCRTELPRLAAYVRDHAGTALYAVDLAEPADRVRRFLAAVGADVPVAIDGDRRLTRALGIDQPPTTLLLDAGLFPRWIVRGDLDWSDPAVRRWLEDPE